MKAKRLANLFCKLARLDEIDCLCGTAELLQSLGYTLDTNGSDYAICTPPIPSPVALVAHCDTVGKELPTAFVNRNGVISAKGGGIIGADDRAGVTAIVATILAGHRPQVYLTTGEERGGIGADILAKYHTPLDTLNVLIQLDRQGSNDFVTYDCESKPLNKWLRKFGWKEAVGSFSDISILAPDWGIAAANISVGYYGQHTEREMVIIPQLVHTIERVEAMIVKPPQQRFEYVERPRIQFSLNKNMMSSSRYAFGFDIEADKSTWPDSPKDAEPLMYADDEICENCGVQCDWLELDGKGFCLDCQSAWNVGIREEA